MGKIRILIYEDNQRLREGLVSLLSTTRDFELLGDFENCMDIKEQIFKYNPHVILMDFDLPEMNGIEGVTQIREVSKELFVIMLIVFDDSTNVYKALHAGANGYLFQKNISEQLIFSIWDVMEGGAPMSSAIAGMITDDVLARGASKTPADYDLTSREVEVSVSPGRAAVTKW